MNLRPIAATFLALGLIASPAMAKKKAAVFSPTPTALPTVVNTDPAVQPENVLRLTLSNGGTVLIRLMPEWAPNHVERIKTLVHQGFYNGIVFHRVIDGFMAQTGDPKGTGEGGSSLPDLKAEFNPMPHVRGSVSMARTDNPDSANSQFFIVYYPHFALDRKYTVFGRVIAGMENADRIERGEPPASPTKIVQAAMLSDNVAAPVVAPVAPQITPEQLNAPIGK